MNKVVLYHIVSKEKEGSYYKLPFQVPEKTRAISISYSYSKTEGSVIDFGLEDEKGQFLGWSGSSHSTITVSECSATPGYLMETIESGEWNILIGAYHVQAEGTKVCYEITFEEEGYSWLFGDLHVHSDASDGEFDIPTLAKMAKEKSLDFIAVTNHNNYAENFSLPKLAGLTIIPGVEWTHYQGHMNFLGIRQPFGGSFIANNVEEMERIVCEAKENGAIVSVNHPKCPFCPYLWKNEKDFQLIEIWNGPMRKANRDALDWWTGFLRQGRRIPAVGGSDYHRAGEPVKLGNPITAVYAKSPSVEDIMDAVKNGHSYITSGVDGVRLSMECEGMSFGDVVEKKETHLIHIEAWNMPENAILKVIDGEGTAEIFAGMQGKICSDLMIKEKGFVYLMAVQKLSEDEEYILAVSNPVYFYTSERESKDGTC